MKTAFDEETGLFITDKGDVLKPIGQWADKDGYRYVTHRHKNLAVHRLIAKSFVKGRSSEKNIVMHLDDDPSNNDPENLIWGTYSENNKSAYDHDLKTTNIHVRCMETGDTFLSAREAAKKMFGIPKRGDHILSAIREQRGKAYGYHWEVVSR